MHINCVCPIYSVHLCVSGMMCACVRVSIHAWRARGRASARVRACVCDSMPICMSLACIYHRHLIKSFADMQSGISGTVATSTPVVTV